MKRMHTITPDKARVITRLALPGTPDQTRNVIRDALALDEAAAAALVKKILGEFSYRHKNFEDVLLKNFSAVSGYVVNANSLSRERKLLIGSYFTGEYSIEAAALFNPSVVASPNQDGARSGETRLLFSFRAVGEGHVSSIVFRSAVINKKNNIVFDPVSRYVSTPNVALDPVYEKPLFERKLKEIGFSNDLTKRVFGKLNDKFTYNEIQQAVSAVKDESYITKIAKDKTIECINWLAKSNYEIEFSRDFSPSEMVIYPVSQNERNGLEDARFVRFIDDDGSVTYYATYTAYNGSEILPQLIETKDFYHFKVLTLNGSMVQNKGMALFPRKINSRYIMISRINGEDLYLMHSDNIHFWYESIKISEPEKPWEFTKIGNCGSPIETERGWLLLTHGVGPMRKYCMGALLLDLEDPSKVVARLDEPLLCPEEDTRDGYVPNVVYSCGSIVLNGVLVLPYATSDTRSHIVTMPVNDILNNMTRK